MPITSPSKVSLAAVIVVLTSCCIPASSAAARNADPVVLQGSQAQRVLGAAPGNVVAFRWQDGWRQVPVQVDERAVVHIGSAYGPISSSFGSVPVPVLTYTDPNTFIGSDPDPSVDANDEIALMDRDAGHRAVGARSPTGVRAGSGIEIAVRDPFDDGPRRYLYLFRSSGDRNPAAGRDYVDYDFVLSSGDYKTTYRLDQGPNPEDSWIRTASYSHHFSDRWLSDQIRITTPGASGVDIFDRHKFLFAPGSCGRSEDTFDFGEGAFVVNRDGPVRAIRSYVGANSGPYVQRTHVFYEGREDIVTDLRVHGIGGGMDFFDYSPAASGMTYRSSLDTGGVAIDGVPETISAAYRPWESVTGPQGGISIVHEFATDVPNFGLAAYWFDDSTPNMNPNSPEYQCTGDSTAFGQSGPRMIGPIPNTDPRLGPANYVKTTRHLYFEEPGAPATRGAQRMAETFLPVTTRARPRARVFVRLRRRTNRPPRLSGSICPAPEGSPDLQRRSRNGFLYARTLSTRSANNGRCRAFGPRALTRPGVYRIFIKADDRQSGGFSRAVRVRR